MILSGNFNISLNSNFQNLAKTIKFNLIINLKLAIMVKQKIYELLTKKFLNAFLNRVKFSALQQNATTIRLK